jgi:mRNA deadenylase 3'-5' endonuclease subunit Ccr4
MILRELFYFDKETVDPVDDKRYEEDYDDSILKKGDTRKTKLTLRQINRIRKAAELHNEESKRDLEYIKQMYGIAANAEAGGV